MELDFNNFKPRKFEQPKTEYKCEKCKDSGFIFFVDEKGNNMARECECRQRRITEARLRQSGISLEEFERKSLNTFRDDTPEAKRMKEMAIKYLGDENALGIGYFGKSGTGKTHICIAICQELINRGLKSRYFSYRADMQKLLKSYYQAEYWEQIQEYTDVDVLYIDDLLKFAKSTRGDILESELRVVYDVVNTRYINHKRTIFSSEYSVGEIIGIDEALGSRIYSMVNPYGMKCEGENRRIHTDF